MKRDVYTDPPLPDDTPANEARQTRRTAKKHGTYKRRADMNPEQLARVRAENLRRQKAYLLRKRLAAGLPPIGKPGRPKKAA